MEKPHRRTCKTEKVKPTYLKINWKSIAWTKRNNKSHQTPPWHKPRMGRHQQTLIDMRTVSTSVTQHILRASHATDFKLLLYFSLTASRSRPCFIHFPARATVRLLLTSAGPQEVSFLMDREKTECFQTWWSWRQAAISWQQADTFFTALA